MFAFALLCAHLAVTPPPSRLAEASDTPATAAVGFLGAGVKAYRAEKYAAAERALLRAVAQPLVNADYARYFLAESLLKQGQGSAAVRHFRAVAQMRSSRFAGAAAWREADSLWESGNQGQAVSRYLKLLKVDAKGPGAALGRFHVGSHLARWSEKQDRPAVTAASRGAAQARTHWEALLVEHPLHALTQETRRRLALIGSKSDGDDGVATGNLSPRAILSRAETLSDHHNWDEALQELDRLPADLATDLGAERDLLRGKTKYRSRRDYPGAAQLLLGVVDALPPSAAAWAAFHGARALSRADRDDEAIVGYHRMIEKFPSSQWAPEARFLSGWLQFNRGRFAHGLADLELTIKDYPRDSFSASAAWYLTLSYYLLAQPAEALRALDVFEQRAHLLPDQRPEERVLYWRARFMDNAGNHERAQEMWRGLSEGAPFSWYGLLAAANLVKAGKPDPLKLLAPTLAATSLAGQPAGRIDQKALRHDVVRRIDELLAADLIDDAGVELNRGADTLVRALGRERGLAVVLDRAHATRSYARAHSLAEVLGAASLDAEPTGFARTIWEAAYPLAHRSLVERYGPEAGNPPHLLYAIMRKESGFDPDVVSYADARGLLQMIPPTSEKVARETGVPYRPEILFEPETNVRLGASYIGSLHRKFREQVALTAGAYNAGPQSMKRWCDNFKQHPTDEFVELVSFAQTREYIKRVIHNYARYRYLYANERFLPGLVLDCRYQEQGPNY